ncbi:sensor histidine kinase [Streptomyces sp. TRM 70351]|uniref:sensor histidine kinase n=1 Tax=Streptomyces sp. TRM 70351 TaxID=3116552 RepID=UPI002E7C4D5A|nr:sensor histidine kinase [Streptomyces sp. TRM 70351]MEE1930255.1 sensor histidine kinase [Streptomyces sp. TRM 70351]
MTSSTMAAPDERQDHAFDHPALFYAGEREFVTGVGAFVRTALAAGEPALVAVPGVRLRALRDDLGPPGEDVTWIDMTQLGRNPGRILSALQDFADRHPDRPARIVGEPIWGSRTPAEMREATRHEALINLAFAGRVASILCPYDTSALPAGVLADAHRTHPVVTRGDVTRPSPHYTDPLRVCADCDVPLPAPPPTVHVLRYGTGDLQPVRVRAEKWMRELGLSAARRTDLLLALCEATTNSVRHGGGSGTLLLWSSDTTAHVETRDAGHFSDPLTGRRRPNPRSPHGGRGVWMIHELCDLVEIRDGRDGLVIRMSMSRTGP